MFWRSKIVKPDEARAQPDHTGDSAANTALETGSTAAGGSASGNEPAITEGEAAKSIAEPTNVVALTSTRLTDRLVTTLAKDSAEPAPASLAKISRKAAVRDTSLGSNALKQALSASAGDGHVLVIAPADGSRLASIVESAKSCAREWPVPLAWVTATTAVAGSKIRVFAVPRADVGQLVSDANQALKSAAAQLLRIAKSDDYKMSLDVLAEERLHASEQPIEQLRRRAEAQNIAVVKTLDGFVLAPMHDGRVVRQDVFRALPASLQRDVESKISALEAELQALITLQPEAASASETKYDALFANVVSQAAQLPFSRLRLKYPETNEARPFLSYLEKVFTDRACDWLSGGADSHFRAGQAFCLSLAQAKAVEPAAPVFLARDVSAAKLMGEFGRDGDGDLALDSGLLSAANGGFLIVEAWRLAAEPQSWLALSAAIEAEEIVPRRKADLIADFEAIPLAARVVLVADEMSFGKLEALDPGIGRHFPTVVRLALHDSQP